MIDNYLIKKVKYFDFPPLSLENIEKLSGKLNVHFSNEFIELAQLADFEYFNHFSINNLDLENDYSVIGDTLRLRSSSNLPQNTLYLCENDASVLLMKCLGDKEEIYWIAIEDFDNFCTGSPLLYNPTIFPNFTDFFEYLINKEEEERKIITS